MSSRRSTAGSEQLGTHSEHAGSSSSMVSQSRRGPVLGPRQLKRIERALGQYVIEVLDSGLTESSQRAYISQAESFVRWLDGKFDPGVRARRRLAKSQEE